jgi:ketosteroid isomerase-like protein
MDPTSEPGERAAPDRARGPAEQRILSMSPDGVTGTSIEFVLRKRLDDLAQAIRDRNVERLMASYAPDVVVFGVRPPLDTRGAAAHRETVEQWFASFAGPLVFELHNLRITPGEGAAFCHYFALVTGSRSTNRTSGYWLRGTTCFARRDGEWLVAHEHLSMPSSM